jgi:hypothetical protein
MADADNGPIPVADNDAAFTDDAIDKVLNPLSEELPGDPLLADKSADLRRLDEVGELAREITEDPIPLVVAQIHEEIQQLLRMHRDICDGIELATDQVQDKQIEFLEEGPEASIAQVFVEFAFAFFLASPLLGKIITGGFRFAGNTTKAVLLADRTKKLNRLTDAAQRVQGKLNDLSKEGTRISEKLVEKREILRLTRTQEKGHPLRIQIGALEDELKQVDAERNKLARVLDKSTRAKQQVEKIAPDKLQAFFKEKEQLLEQYGVAAVKAGKSGADKAKGTLDGRSFDPAPDSIGVQIKAIAQAHLRDMELYLGLAAADADLLRSIAQSEPFLAPDCFNLLSEMLDAVARVKRKNEQIENVKRETMLAFEKLIWALLLEDQLAKDDPISKELSDKLSKPEPGWNAPRYYIQQFEQIQFNPLTKRLTAYLAARFIPPQDLTNEQQIIGELRSTVREFRKLSDVQQVFELYNKPLPLKPDAGPTPAPASTPPP